MRAQEERDTAKKHNPAKALRNNPEATVVDVTALGEFIDHK